MQSSTSTTIDSRRRATNGQPLTLPGTLLGVIESTVYARSNGYVVRWLKDIGSSVKKGELLAEIAAPEIDQEISQADVGARAGGGQRATSPRAPPIAGRPCGKRTRSPSRTWMSARAPTTKRKANLDAADANVGRLRKLQGFNQVVAPFDGVVTRRNIDVGDLVNAGNGGTGQALFSVAQVDPLRLYVYVPQIYAHQIKIGDAVTVTLAERAGEEYQGTIARTARAIDTVTRTMQVEIRFPIPTAR